MKDLHPAGSVLVIVPCLNEAANIDTIVETFAAQVFGSGALIVVADGGSTDGTVEKIQALEHKHACVRYLNNPKKIQSAAINLAVEVYGDAFHYLVRIDAHADYPDDYITVLVQEAKDNAADSVVVPMLTTGKTEQQDIIAAVQNSRLGNGGSLHRMHGTATGQWVDHGHHALMKIAAFNDIGGYDETFSHNEDAELDVRLSQAGNKIWLTAKTHLLYYPRSAFRPLAKQYRGYGAGRARTMVKHRMRPKLRQMIPAFVAPAAVGAVLSPLFWPLGVPFALWAILVAGLSASTAYKRSGSMRLPGYPKYVWAAAVMHLAWSAGFVTSLARMGLHITEREKPKGTDHDT